MNRKRFLLFILCTSITFFDFYASAQSVKWVNDSVRTQITTNTFVVITGDVINKSGALFDNSGSINLYGNWSNNAGNMAFVNSSPGTVSLKGDTQIIDGISPSKFFNFDLLGTGVKILQVNNMVEGVLSLNDRELQTNFFIMSVLNADTSAITRTTGFVSSLDLGCISRAMNASLPYLFPVGSSVGTLRYRPVTITPASVGPDTFSVRMANVDATTEGFDRSITDGTVDSISYKFYHRINRISGTGAAKISLYYDNIADGVFYGVTHWQNTPDRWENVGTVAAINNTSPVLSSISVDNWSDFSGTPFGLYSCIPSITPMSITASVNPVCAGSATTLSVSGGSLGTGATWQWYADSCGGNFIGTGTSLSINPDSAITYFVRAEGTCNTTACASVFITSIPVYTDTISASICNGQSYNFGGVDYTITGNYSYTYTSISGCDSTVVLKLIVNNNSNGDTIATSCDTFLWYGTSYISTGTATHTFTNSLGCDSVVTLHLTINNSNTGDTTVTACNNFTWYGITYSSSTTQLHTLTNIHGCDSVVTLHLTVNYNNTGDTTAVACNNFNWYGTTYITTSTATHVLTNTAGCDSTVTLHLTVNHSSIGDTTATVCNNFSWYGATYTTTGTATHIFTNSQGCDSVVTLHLTVNNNTSGDTIAHACNSFIWYGITYNSNTIATHTFTNIHGCDSIVALHLTINPAYTDTISESICNGQTFNFGGTPYSTSGMYQHTFTSVAGCDSVVTLNLVVNPDFPVSVSINANPGNAVCEGTQVTISAAPVNGGTNPSYQWYVNGILAGTGSFITRNTFFVQDMISCVLISSLSSCVTGNPATSNTITLDINPIPELSFNTTKESCNGANDGSIDLSVSNGAFPYVFNWSNGETTEDINSLSPGRYTVQVTDANSCKSQDFIEVSTGSTSCIYIPNIFSPNGDSKNDRLFVRGRSIKSLEFRIYDRWGNMVFESNDPNTGWDGTYNDTPMNAAVFVYYVKAEMYSGNIIEQKGNVTLIK